MLRILWIIFVFTSTVRSIQVQRRYSIGDRFIYSENRTKTTINLFTGEKTIAEQELIYTELIVKIDGRPFDSDDVEIEKIYSFVQFTPSDQCATQRLLSQRFREHFQPAVESTSIQYAVGQRWKDTTNANLDRYTTVVRIYPSEEYHTTVIVLDMEILGAIELLQYQSPVHFLVTKEIDVETGILLLEQATRQTTSNGKRRTDVIVKKLIQRKTDNHSQ